MSDFTYLDVYTLTGVGDNLKAGIDSLRAAIEERILQALGGEELSADLRERFDAELAWVERSGTLASWSALARLVEAAQERGIPLGAPLGCADGTLIGSALCSVLHGTLNARPLEGMASTTLPPGVEVPGERREELLHAVAPEGSWSAWAPDGPVEAGQVALWLRPSSALSVLDGALRMAAGYPSSDFATATANPPEWPTLSERATALLKKADVAGIKYLSARALKDWKGDASPESMAGIVARSVASRGNTKPPDGVVAWVEYTGDTNGALLYYDQFDRIVGSAAGISPGGAGALRLAMLNGQANLDGALRARFLAGCASSGLDEQSAEGLWGILAAVAPDLISRQAAYAWARVAVLLANVKAAHPAAFIAAALDACWEREGRAGIPPLVGNARRAGVSILPADIAQSHVGPTLERASDGWAVRWGLAFLPGWDRHIAGRFVDARSRLGDCNTLPDVARGAVEAELSLTQVEALVHSGACDRLGGRDVVTGALLSDIEWARQLDGSGTGTCPYDAVAPEAPPGPRLRYARRAWEEQNLGVAFTDAHEIDDLHRAIGESAGLNGALTRSAGIGLEQVGRSVCLVGLLYDVRLLTSESERGDKPGEVQQMAVAWVEDLEGAIELMAFPPNYKRHQELWAENNMVIITARVRGHADGEGVYLLCEHLAAYHAQADAEEINITIKPARRNAATVPTEPLPTPNSPNANGGSHKPELIAQTDSSYTEIPDPKSEVRNLGESPNYQLIITLPTSEDDRVDIDRMIALDKLLKAHDGPDAVTLRIPYSPETGAVTSAQLPRGVRYSLALEARIRELLGLDALALIKLLG